MLRPQRRRPRLAFFGSATQLAFEALGQHGTDELLHERHLPAGFETHVAAAQVGQPVAADAPPLSASIRF